MTDTISTTDKTTVDAETLVQNIQTVVDNGWISELDANLVLDKNFKICEKSDTNCQQTIPPATIPTSSVATTTTPAPTTPAPTTQALRGKGHYVKVLHNQYLCMYVCIL